MHESDVGMYEVNRMQPWLVIALAVLLVPCCGRDTSEDTGAMPEPAAPAVTERAETEQDSEAESESAAGAAVEDVTKLQATVTHAAMGTEFSFTLYAREGDTGTDAVVQIAEEAFGAIDALEARISRWRPDSQTSYLNNRAAKEAVRVAPDIRDLIVYAEQVYEESGGAFDPTVGPLIQLWGFYKGEGRLPTDDELGEALSKVGMDKVVVDESERTVRFKMDGIMLDFGGIGKGLALDRAAQALRDYGVTSAVLHAGTSSVVAIGAPPGEAGWTVRIRNPYNQEEYIDEVVLRDESLSTSGSYEKFFELDGKKYCHIFDPRTGRPVEGILSATVLAETGTMTDALSTAFFVMGEDTVRDYCGDHPEIRAVIVPMPDDDKPEPRRINFAAGKEQ
jgi:thiamine biosynthesis lipoprotein